MNRRNASCGCVLVSCLAFGTALVSPLFTIHPAAGKWTELVNVIDAPALAPNTYTLPGGILELWTGNERLLALLLGTLSLLLPMAKLCVLWWEGATLARPNAAVLRVFRAAAAYAMTEPFLIALLVLVVKGMPGGSRVDLHAGVWFFVVSVVVSLVAARIELRDSAPAPQRAHQ